MHVGSVPNRIRPVGAGPLWQTPSYPFVFPSLHALLPPALFPFKSRGQLSGLVWPSIQPYQKLEPQHRPRQPPARTFRSLPNRFHPRHHQHGLHSRAIGDWPPKGHRRGTPLSAHRFRTRRYTATNFRPPHSLLLLVNRSDRAATRRFTHAPFSAPSPNAAPGASASSSFAIARRHFRPTITSPIGLPTCRYFAIARRHFAIAPLARCRFARLARSLSLRSLRSPCHTTP